MSYLVLARKYRPQTFDDVVGQKPIVRTLRNSLARNRVAHAMLFSGVRGVGKTTLARIMAKAINCESEQDRPCNNCTSCKAIAAGQAIDLHEIDGASNRGIQEIRELKENIRFMPTSSRYKIIIIDEVHMLTTEAFNALLKTLEEPPEHVYFMFATTELHKIPITILSRCQRYELKRITGQELYEHFRKIAENEKVQIDQEGLGLIVREAEGSVRDGLSLLDQVLSFGDTTITHQDVIQVLGLTDRNILFTTADALLTGNRETALQTLHAAFENGLDIKRFTSDLLETFRTLLLIKIGNLEELLDLPKEEIARFQEIAAGVSFETIHLRLEMLLKGFEEIKYTFQPRLTLENTFLKIIEAGNITALSTLLGKIDSLLQGLPEEAPATPPLSRDNISRSTTPPRENIQPTPIQPEQENPPQQAVQAVQAVQAEQTEPLPAKAPRQPLNESKEPAEPRPPAEKELPPKPATSALTEERDLPAEAPDKPEKASPPVGQPKQQEVPPSSASTATQDAPLQTTAASGTLSDNWPAFLEYVKTEKLTPWLALELAKAEQLEEEDRKLCIHFSESASSALLDTPANKKMAQDFLLDFFQKNIHVEYIFPVAAEDDDEAEDSPARLRKQITNDPQVQMTVEVFNGSIGNIRLNQSNNS